MNSKKTGRFVKHAVLVLAIAVILASTACNLGTLWDFNRYGVGALGNSSLGI